MKRTRAAVAYGSNLGDRQSHIEAALRRLAAHPGIRLLRRSQTIETEPVGGPSQGPFLNGVVLVETQLSPRQLLAHLLRVEDQGGRVRQESNGPRTIDLDLILFGDTVLTDADCRVPHPRAAQRGFVLQPLAEVAADWRHPEAGCSVSELLARWQESTTP